MARWSFYRIFIVAVITIPILLRLVYSYLIPCLPLSASTFATVLSQHAASTVRSEELRRTLFDTEISSSLRKLPTSCESTKGLCLRWEEQVELRLSTYEDDGAECYMVVWQSLHTDHAPQDCISMKRDRWYGGSETQLHHWPINPTSIRMQPYITNDIGMLEEPGHGSIQERYWLASNGVALTVDEHVPLHVGMTSNKHLCLRSQYKDSPFTAGDRILPKLEYTVCYKSNILDVHRYMSNRLWKKPNNVPSLRVLKDPIWSTWSKFKENVTQADVLSFAGDIVKHGFTTSQIEIDDGYAEKYGDHDFNSTKFPDPVSMTAQLHQMGFAISMWVTPFVNNDSKGFHEGVEKSYFIQNEENSGAALVRWWRGWAGMLDVTNTDAVAWYYKRLKSLIDVGIDTFKFDAGEVGFMPYNSNTKQYLPNPNMYSARYVEAAYENTNSAIEIRTGHRTQHLPVIVRVMDKDSNWLYNRGFKSLIPNALQFSLLGYPFILPDMIGGDGHAIHGSDQYALPDKVLYIRWIQLSIFFPSMQFSFTPWQYDEETISISLKLMKLRTDFIVPIILKAAEQSVATGEPIIRPLWWIAPTDPLTFDIDSQFLIGDDLLVAPIVEQGVTSRDIYLPTGRWKDMLHHTQIVGPHLLRNYAVALDEVAYFLLQV